MNTFRSVQVLIDDTVAIAESEIKVLSHHLQLIRRAACLLITLSHVSDQLTSCKCSGTARTDRLGLKTVAFVGRLLVQLLSRASTPKEIVLIRVSLE